MVELPAFHPERDLRLRRLSPLPRLEASFHEIAIGARLDPTQNDRLFFKSEHREVPPIETAILASHPRFVEEFAFREAFADQGKVIWGVLQQHLEYDPFEHVPAICFEGLDDHGEAREIV